MRKVAAVVLLMLVVVLAFAGGFLTRGLLPGRLPAGGPEARPAAAARVYTCSMHPQVRLPAPGNCPICEMPLIPADSAAPGPGTVPLLTLSEHALAMASVETTPVTRRDLRYDLRTVGLVRYNESSLATITARIDGYAEKLFVNVTGVTIKAGDHLADIYSPDLIIGQQELLTALTGGAAGEQVETTKLKLRRWGLTDAQIEDVARTGKVAERGTLYSPISGTVIEKMIVENSAVRAGDVLYRIANLDTVWVYLDIYEADLAKVRYGQPVELIAEAYPGRRFNGIVTFVEPLVDETTRTIRVPVHVANPDHALMPGMYARAVIRGTPGPDGNAAATGMEGKFACRMHPQVLADVAGACPLCGMPLDRIPGEPAVRVSAAESYSCPMKCEGDKTYPAPGNCPVCSMKLLAIPHPDPADGLLAVPRNAVLDSGTRTLVYVEQGRGTFAPREVVLGPRCGDFYPVLEGLSAGERVVARGGFLIDSQFQITGHPSLFYPGGLRADPVRGTADELDGAAPSPNPSGQGN